ncbi:MAG: ribosome biogenesis/translation initiation ATPase RLI [Crenarchaeota archaeon]|nr:ribosome biogenesis/translation initiation ATPase RLI [Thermoproteota archaeon]MCR8500750.1 ribosome biogenesis/translation initiation ATPase RLI [Thermoproteota archaeon]
MLKEKRVVIIDHDRCNPKRCPYNCMKICPPQRSGQKVFNIDENGFPIIDESLCIGCGLCVRACNFRAIKIARVPAPLEKDLIFRYGPNQFELYRLPLISEGEVTGLVGQNGTGKSTSLKILAGLLRPNFGKYEQSLDWDEILERFRGTTLQNYFEALANKRLRIVYKPQQVDAIPHVVKDSVRNILEKHDERGIMDIIVEELLLNKVLNRKTTELAGGELQKLAIAIALEKNADVYLFDEPSSYLDIRERLRIANIIYNLSSEQKKTVVVAEHDLAMLDYMSDKVCLYYGTPGAFGIVSKPKSAREGINVFLNGYDPAENYLFRDTPIKFHQAVFERPEIGQEIILSYPAMKKKLGDFELIVESGQLTKGEVIGIAGPNAIGKTTFLKLLVGIIRPDEGNYEPPGGIIMSYKPQYLQEFLGDEYWMTVNEKIRSVNPRAMSDPWFKNFVINPFDLEYILDRRLDELSGGELQRVAIATTLARDAEIYVLDEPGAYISAEDRFLVAKAIRELAQRKQCCIVVVEHDILLLDYFSDRIIVFDGQPGIRGQASKPLSLREGMNTFLKYLGITFRRDPETYRPRINKIGSRLDIEQKARGEYYYTRD